MRAEDPTIKVGPAIQCLSSSSEQAVLDTIFRRQPDGTFLPLDFIGYHPYQKLNEQTTTDGIEAGLRGIYDDHLAKINNIKNRLTLAGRDPSAVALVASEHNASNWTSTDNLHLYTTRNSKTRETELWALNFDNDTNIQRSTPINNVGGRGKITLYTLGALVGPSSLASSNLASDMTGGPTHNVDWTTA